MRAYIAILKDSFREACASRVLWIVLVLITLFLLALVPLSSTTEAPYLLQTTDIRFAKEFMETLERRGESAKLTPGRHVWGLLSDGLKTRIGRLDAESRPNEPLRVKRALRNELNELLGKRDFYDAGVWRNVSLNKEGKTLLATGFDGLSDQRAHRLNRLLFDAAFPAQITPVAAGAVHFVYFGMEFGQQLGLTEEQANVLVEQVLAGFMSWAVGFFGVVIAVLVTASIVPNMFDPGAIDLLLSKPITRTMLFLTKFLGGCSFILFSTAYLIFGLWLLAGFRFDLWHAKLLLCIPLFMFLFAILYSVSALAGVLWRNAIVSVIITIIFWGGCFSIGVAKGFMELTLNGDRAAVVIPAGETVLASRKSGETLAWNANENNWKTVFRTKRDNGGPPQPMQFGLLYPMLGPVYDENNDRIVAIRTMLGRLDLLGASGTLLVGRQVQDWRQVQSVSTPSGTKTLFIDPKGETVIAGPAGVFRFEGDATVGQQPFKVFGFDLNKVVAGQAGSFKKVSPDPLPNWVPPFEAAMDPQTGNLAVFAGGKLFELEQQEDGTFATAEQRDLETEEPAVLAYSGKTILVALGNGEIRTFLAGSLTPKLTFQPYADHKPKTVHASADGRWFAVLYHHRRLWLFDAQKKAGGEADVSGQSEISAAAFSGENRLLVADRFPRILEYGMDPLQVERRYEAPASTLESVYRYGFKPLYTVFPKPGELDNMVQYLLTDQKSAVIGQQEFDLQAERVTFDIWQPLWSNLAFLTIVLGFTCLYVSRKDF